MRGRRTNGETDRKGSFHDLYVGGIFSQRENNNLTLRLKLT